MAKRQVLQIRPQELSWEEALERFLRFKAAEGLREATLKDYRQKLSQFFRKDPSSWPHGLEQPLLDWLASAKAASTYNLRLGYMRVFLEWARERSMVAVDPLAGLHMRRKPDRIVDIPENVISELFTLPNKDTYVGLRDYTLFALFLDTGVRPHEAFELLVSDIDLSAREIRIRPEVAKTGLARTLPLADVTVRALDDFVAVRPREWPDTIPVFTSAYGRKLNKDTWGDIMERYSMRLGRKVRGYDLRHVFALAFLRRGGNAFALQRIMGHRTMDMTRRYVNLVQGDIREMHRQASPVSSLVQPTRPGQKVPRIALQRSGRPRSRE
jgi:site-specific recombinase XerD